jgi:hypothetical protein
VRAEVAQEATEEAEERECRKGGKRTSRHTLSRQKASAAMMSESNDDDDDDGRRPRFHGLVTRSRAGHLQRRPRALAKKENLL